LPNNSNNNNNIIIIIRPIITNIVVVVVIITIKSINPCAISVAKVGVSRCGRPLVSPFSPNDLF